MPIVVIDEIYAEVTSDPEHYAKDREVKAFLDGLRGHGLTVEQTFVGRQAKLAREQAGFRRRPRLTISAVAWVSSCVTHHSRHEAGDAGGKAVGYARAYPPYKIGNRNPGAR